MKSVAWLLVLLVASFSAFAPAEAAPQSAARPGITLSVTSNGDGTYRFSGETVDLPPGTVIVVSGLKDEESRVVMIGLGGAFSFEGSGPVGSYVTATAVHLGESIASASVILE